MTTDEMSSAYSAVIVIENQEILKQLNVADYPMMKREARNKLHRHLFKLAFPDQKKKVITMEDLKKILPTVE